MNTFLNKHDIDVGKTFGVVFLLAMVYQIYDMILYFIFLGPLTLNFGFIILYFLGVGMYRHNNTARRLTLLLAWLGVVLFIGSIIASPFISGEKFTIGQTKIEDPPFWKVVLFFVTTLPVFWITIASLSSEKARQEFKATGKPLPQT